MAPEKRIDPDDGAAYTFEELSAYYAGKFKKKAIAAYWESECRPTARAKAKAKAKAKFKVKAKAETAVKKEPKAEPPLDAIPFDETKNRQIVVTSLFKSNKQAMVSNRQIKLVATEKPTPEAGQVLIRNMYVSIDPTHRIWFTDKPQYLAPADKDAPMRAGTLGKVEVSNDPSLPVGSWVTGFGGVQDYYVSSSAMGAAKVEEVAGRPITAHLSVLSLIIGMAAWGGTMEIIKPKEGDIFVVSGGAGAVGSLAGQLAKIAGAKVIGFCGSESKAKWLKEECGFDEVINYKTEKVSARLKELAPDGVDCYFDNTGGVCTEAAFSNFRNNARVAVCGVISAYNSGREASLRNYENILHKRVMVKGFICMDYGEKFPDMVSTLIKHIEQGKIKYQEDIQEGIENYASILNKLFTGSNSGKLIMKI